MSQQKKIWPYVIGIVLIILVIKYSGLIFQSGQALLSISMPLIMGCAIAYALNILVVRFEKLSFLSNKSSPVYKFRRGISVCVSLLVITFVVALVTNIVIPQIVEAIGVIVSGLPPMLKSFADWAAKTNTHLPRIQDWLNSLSVNWPQLSQKIITYLSSGVSNIFASAISVISGVGGVIVQFVLSLIFAMYILAGKERLSRQFYLLADVYLKEKTCKALMYVLTTAHNTFSKFIVGQCTEAIIIGVLCTIGMLILRFPYATMIGTMVGATALLPVVGAYIGAIVGAFMIMTISPVKSAAFIVFIVVLQQLEGNLIYPRVVGSSIGLPGIWVLAAVTIGGGLGGVVGMLLAVPVTATVYKLLQKDVSKRRAAIINKDEDESPSGIHK